MLSQLSYPPDWIVADLRARVNAGNSRRARKRAREPAGGVLEIGWTHDVVAVEDGMGSHHPAEYFAESIMNPNRVIVQGPGYTGPDGLSKMPDYNDVMTVRQLVDVVAYLKSLKGGMSDGAGKPMDMKGHDMK